LIVTKKKKLIENFIEMRIYLFIWDKIGPKIPSNIHIHIT
jgi:hypothetical protein